MLITSRRSAPESRHLGAYEVVFGVTAARRRLPRQRVQAQDGSARHQYSAAGPGIERRIAESSRSARGNQEHAAAGAGARQPVPSPSEVRRTVRGTGCRWTLAATLRPRDCRRCCGSARAAAPIAGNRLRCSLARSRSPRSFDLRRTITTREPLQAGSSPCARRPTGRRQNHHADQNRDSRMSWLTACLSALSRVDPYRVGVSRKAAQLRRHHRRRFHRHHCVQEFLEAVRGISHQARDFDRHARL